MNSGRKANQLKKMHGCVNEEKKLTDIYLPRKCEYSDKVITSKDRSSIQLSICEVFLFLLYRLMKMEQSTSITNT
jgi:hypothetical protein